MERASVAGVDRFVADLAECGTAAIVEGVAVTFSLRSLEGTRRGEVVRSAVGVNELSAWPAVPPHWVHLPSEIIISPTNPDTEDCLPGWTRHSRDIQNWRTSDHPGQAWLAHVRSVLSNAA